MSSEHDFKYLVVSEVTAGLVAEKCNQLKAEPVLLIQADDEIVKILAKVRKGIDEQ